MGSERFNQNLLNVDMPSWYYDGGGVARTRNLGTYTANAPMLADGATPALFPTQAFPHGMNFNGATQYIQVVNDGTFDFRSGGADQPFSVEVVTQMRSPGTGTPVGICGKGDVASVQGGWGIYHSGAAAFRVGDAAGNYLGRVDVTANKLALCYNSMVHLVGTYNGNGTSAGMLLYINTISVGIESSAGVYTGLPSDNRPVYVGRFKIGAGTFWYPGFIPNFAVYPFVLEPGEIASLYRKRLALLQRGA